MNIDISSYFIHTLKLFRFVPLLPFELWFFLSNFTVLVDALFISQLCRIQPSLSINLIFPALRSSVAQVLCFGSGGSALIGKTW